MTTATASKFEFVVPPELEASEPPEARGLGRDEVRLMVSEISAGQIRHARFRDLPELLDGGDILVINTSRTRNAALNAMRRGGTRLQLHLSTHVEDDRWTAEVRSLDTAGHSQHFDGAHPGERLELAGGASAVLLAPYVSDCEADASPSETLWQLRLQLPVPVDEYLLRHGSPIRYNYVKDAWPLSYFQTVYATESGSAEMPSAGRPFTRALLDRLQEKGIQVAPLILHTGVSNLETHEPPYKEYYRVPAETALLVNEARRVGKRVVAVGTTVVRALESLADTTGMIHAGEGWTCLVIKSESRLQAVTALLTGMHHPEATHLGILEALAGPPAIQTAYTEALQRRYLWHEFGDLHLIMA